MGEGSKLMGFYGTKTLNLGETCYARRRPEEDHIIHEFHPPFLSLFFFDYVMTILSQDIS